MVAVCWRNLGTFVSDLFFCLRPCWTIIPSGAVQLEGIVATSCFCFKASWIASQKLKEYFNSIYHPKSQRIWKLGFIDAEQDKWVEREKEKVFHQSQWAGIKSPTPTSLCPFYWPIQPDRDLKRNGNSKWGELADSLQWNIVSFPWILSC